MDFGRKTASNLALQNVNVQFREYKNVDHELAPDEVCVTLLPTTDGTVPCRCIGIRYIPIPISVFGG